MLVTGEPGIGKSRLGEEFAATARLRGAQVHWGRCWEAGGAPPYWPWIQLIRSCVRSTGAERARDVLGAQGPLLARLVPEFVDVAAVDPAPPTSDPDLERFHLFEAAARLLRATASEGPLVFVLDDLHAADTPSLLLLQFLAGDLIDAGVGFLGLYRSADLAPGHELAASEAALLRLPGAQRITLSGLDRGAVGELIERTSGREASPAVVTAVHERTASFLRSVTDEGLDRIVDRRWNPPVTLGVRLVSVIDDCAQSIDDIRSPGCQSRTPTKLKPPPLKTLAWSPTVNSLIRLMM